MIAWSEFISLASKAFEFLRTEFGFVQTSAESPFINYENRDHTVRVSIYYDVNRRGEIELGLLRASDIQQGKPFVRLQEFARFGPWRFPEPPLQEFASSKSEVESVLNEMAARLKRNCSSVLAGDLSGFEAIERARVE